MPCHPLSVVARFGNQPPPHLAGPRAALVAASALAALAALAALGLLASGAADAQAPRAAARSVRFTSTYTDLSRDCRPAGTPRTPGDADPAESGQDIPLLCPGPGGQAVYVSYSAWAASLYVGAAKTMPDGRERLIATQAVDFTDRPGRRLEWRLANGRPFAAILRVTDYARPADSAENPYAVRYARGEKLVAVGLPGFTPIALTLNAGRADANAELRRRVDALYAAGPASRP